MSGKKPAQSKKKKKAARRRERRASSSAAAVAALDDDDDHDGSDNNGISNNQRAPQVATNAFLSPEELIFYAKYLLRKMGWIDADLPTFSKTKRKRMDSCTIHRKAELTEYIPLQVFTAFVDEANRQLIEDPTEQASCSTLTKFVMKRNPTPIKSRFLMEKGPFETFVEQEFTTPGRQAVWFTKQGRQAVSLSLETSTKGKSKKIVIGGVVNAFIPHATAIASATKTHVHDALNAMDSNNEDTVATELWDRLLAGAASENVPLASSTSSQEQHGIDGTGGRKKTTTKLHPFRGNAPTALAASKNGLPASSTSGQQQHGIDGAGERNNTRSNDAALRAELERLQGELSAVTRRFEASWDESALQQQVRELQAELKRVSDKNVELEANLKRVRGKNKVQAKMIVYLQNQLEASQDSDSYDSNDSDYSNDRPEQVPDSDSFDDGWPSSPVSRTQTQTSPTFQESGGSTGTIETPPKHSPARTPRPAGSSHSSEFGDSQTLSSGQAPVRGRVGVDNQDGLERDSFPNTRNDDWGAVPAFAGDSFSSLGGDADVFSDDSQTAAPNETLYSTSLAMDRTTGASVSALQWIETEYASSPSTAAGSPASIATGEGAYLASSTSASEEVPVPSRASRFDAPRAPNSADTSTAYLEGSGGSEVQGEQDSSVVGSEEESEAGGDNIGSTTSYDDFFSDDGNEQSKQKTKQDGPPAYEESGSFDGRRKMVHVEGSPETVNVTAENPRRKLSVYNPKEKCKHEPFCAF